MSKEQLSPDMCSEIDRLGLERSWFQWVVDQEGLEFARFCLSKRTKEADLFDLWYPRAASFAVERRSQSPLPVNDDLSSMDAATLRILEPKIRDAERVPCKGNYTAAFFTAPLHALPLVSELWPSSYRNPIFLTPAELAEWRQLYDSGESDQESWWFVFQDWNAEPNPASDSFWLRDTPIQGADDVTPVLVTWGLCWGSLAGGHHAELWGVDADGKERFLQDVGDVQY
jgi:hypothetical protein